MSGAAFSSLLLRTRFANIKKYFSVNRQFNLISHVDALDAMLIEPWHCCIDVCTLPREFIQKKIRRVKVVPRVEVIVRQNCV